jgi:hypothetical protein
MKFLASKFALPIASVIAVITLVGVQAMALSQSPSDKISAPEQAKVAGDSTQSDPAGDPNAAEPQPSTTPLIIPTDGPTTLPQDDEEYEDDEDYDDEYEDREDYDDEYEDDEDYDDDEEGDDD